MYIYICNWVYEMHVYMYNYVYIYIYTCMHVCMSTCLSVCLHVLYVCLYVCQSVCHCMSVCLHACMHVRQGHLWHKIYSWFFYSRVVPSIKPYTSVMNVILNTSLGNLTSGELPKEVPRSKKSWPVNRVIYRRSSSTFWGLQFWPQMTYKKSLACTTKARLS